MRTSTYFFNDALISLDCSGRFAIFIGNENNKYLLVQNPGGNRIYTTQKVRDSNTKEKTVTATYAWDDELGLFQEVVREVLDDDDFTSGK